MKSSPSGFTLLEVLAAFAIIAIVLPAVAKGISVCVKGEAQARELEEATRLAEGKLAELISSSGWEGQGLSGRFSPERPEVRWTAASSAQDGDLLEVLVVVTWTDPGGDRSVRLSTFMYSPVSR